MWQTQDPVGYQSWDSYTPQIHIQWKNTGYFVPWLKEFQAEYKNERCTAILLTNIADMTLIRVNCSEPMLQNIMCQIPKYYSINATGETIVENDICNNSIKINQVCYLFYWISTCNSTKTKTMANPGKHLTKILQHLHLATPNLRFGPVFDQHCASHFSTQRHIGLVHQTIQADKTNGGFVVNSFQFHATEIHPYLFKCGEGSFILAYFLCDGQNDCELSKNSSDEASCHCSLADDYNYQCKFINVSSTEQKCSEYYYKLHDGECKMYIFLTDKSNQSDQPNRSKKSQTYFECDNGKKLEEALVNDLQFDCPTSGKDEQLLLNSMNDTTFYQCSEPHLIPCRDGHPACYNISQLCIYYFVGKTKFLATCRTGEHLASCSHFDCGIHYKCPKSYCIPWNYVCDGNWDCPHGKDESPQLKCGPTWRCINLYQCKHSATCVHVTQVCDDYSHCPHSDDEEYCSESTTACPTHCSCLLSAVICKRINITSALFKQLIQRSVLVFQGVSLSHPKEEQPHNNSVVFLSIRNSVYLMEFCQLIQKSPALLFVESVSNNMGDLESFCFEKLQRLKHVNLSHNNICTLKSFLFSRTPNLKAVDVSENPLTQIQKNIFVGTPKLSYFGLRTGAFITDFDANILLDIEGLKIFDTTNYKMCCFIKSGVKCTSSLPWYLSCSNLLPRQSIQIVSKFFSLAVLSLNVLSLVVQIVSFKKKIQTQAASVIALALTNISDAILSLPLLILWTFDLIYKNTFIKSELHWRNSLTCYLIYALFLKFSVFSPACLTFLAFQRLELVRDPITTPYKKSNFVLRRSSLIFGSSILCSGFTTGLTKLNTSLLNRGLPTPLCYPFVDPEGAILAVMILMGIAVLLKLGSVTFIVKCYLSLVIHTRESSKKVSSAIQK